MSKKRIYEGTCRGGPMDGTHVVYEHKMLSVNVPVFPEPPKAMYDAPDDSHQVPRPLFDVEMHHYRHVLGQWVWQR